MFKQATQYAAEVDKTFIFIIGISLFFLIGLTTTMIVFAVKYRRSKHPVAVQIKENIFLEIGWIVVPLIIVLAMFWYGYSAYMPSRNIPKDAIPIKVIGKMWNWTFDYGDNKITTDTLYVPVNKAIRLNMETPDVTHSFFVPAFRIKEDLVPGQLTYLWFKAEREGIFEILCAEYCGLRHSFMEGRVIVMSDSAYSVWLTKLKTASNQKPEGLTLIQNNGCAGCHSSDGSKLVGPTFKNSFGTKRIIISNGVEKEIIADTTYLKKSIIDPDADVVKDFNKGLMKSYKTTIKEADIDKIVNYLKTMNDKK